MSIVGAPVAAGGLSDRAVNSLVHLFEIDPNGYHAFAAIDRHELRRRLAALSEKRGRPVRWVLLSTGGCGRRTANEILQWIGVEQPVVTIDKDRLATLGRLAKELMEPTELLNEKLRAAQSAIVRMKLGVSATVTQLGVSLSWGKNGGEWILYAGRDESSPQMPLLSCSREVRSLAARLLPALLDALDKKLGEDTAQVHAAIESVDAFLAAFPKDESDATTATG